MACCFFSNLVPCHWHASSLPCYIPYWRLTPSNFVFISIFFLVVCCYFPHYHHCAELLSNDDYSNVVMVTAKQWCYSRVYDGYCAVMLIIVHCSCMTNIGDGWRSVMAIITVRYWRIRCGDHRYTAMAVTEWWRLSVFESDGFLMSTVAVVSPMSLAYVCAWLTGLPDTRQSISFHT